MTKHNEDKFESNIRQGLDEAVDTLDANTLSRIRQIRTQAVEKEKIKTEGLQLNWLFNKQRLFVGGLATACVMVLAMMLLFNSPTSIQTIPEEDIELISSSDNLEFFEDLEFYEWLEEDALPS
ncbi:MAG: DUF3619 family protein [Gammaproteobacteria bacterium]|jgi:hypothetical protein|nr:DUF3619 family protein [Gammaproteobacteria bacterium]